MLWDGGGVNKWQTGHVFVCTSGECEEITFDKRDFKGENQLPKLRATGGATVLLLMSIQYDPLLV